MLHGRDRSDGSSLLAKLTQNGTNNTGAITTPQITMNVTNDGTINVSNGGTITGYVINNNAFNVTGTSTVNLSFTNNALVR